MKRSLLAVICLALLVASSALGAASKAPTPAQRATLTRLASKSIGSQPAGCVKFRITISPFGNFAKVTPDFGLHPASNCSPSNGFMVFEKQYPKVTNWKLIFSGSEGPSCYDKHFSQEFLHFIGCIDSSTPGP